MSVLDFLTCTLTKSPTYQKKNVSFPQASRSAARCGNQLTDPQAQKKTSAQLYCNNASNGEAQSLQQRKRNRPTSILADRFFLPPPWQQFYLEILCV
ncbi:hypothetical protein GDO81_026871 [Engystomops pustulosus]|uniref:Uncharacterized protein n=1 Tax=Engystomops pustulosus TaxID=76066 RepID=A0AAV6ZFB4_ENGPU|nr:hypothetical protein GDO81_026871 [Engystomops pustulosus]